MTSVLDNEAESLVTAHAVMTLVGLGNPIRLPILVGVEKAVNDGVLKIEAASIDRNLSSTLVRFERAFHA